MTRKQDFLRSQQNRDKHPESGMVGSAAEVEAQQRRAGAQNVNERDRQEPHSGKYANDHNKMGDTAPTQKNEGRRTPQSRHDNEVHVGGDNQVQARRGYPNAGENRGPSGG